MFGNFLGQQSLNINDFDNRPWYPKPEDYQNTQCQCKKVQNETNKCFMYCSKCGHRISTDK